MGLDVPSLLLQESCAPSVVEILQALSTEDARQTGPFTNVPRWHLKDDKDLGWTPLSLHQITIMYRDFVEELRKVESAVFGTMVTDLGGGLAPILCLIPDWPSSRARTKIGAAYRHTRGGGSVPFT